MVLFDIRIDDSHVGFIAAVHRGLDNEPGNPYLSRFGPIASPSWWGCFDRGELPIGVLSGEVTHVGQRLDWCDEIEDVIEFTCSGLATLEDPVENGGGTTTLHRIGTAHPHNPASEAIVYERVDHWTAHPIRVGDRVYVTRTVADLVTQTGPVRYLIDVRAEWLPAGGTGK
ncbi:MAG: hypothetical protein ABI353_16770 [Isosphaeraceae bacterium]